MSHFDGASFAAVLPADSYCTWALRAAGSNAMIARIKIEHRNFDS
jgi:hypothetical protein